MPPFGLPYHGIKTRSYEECTRGFSIIAMYMYTTGHMENELVGVVYIAIIKRPRVHSSCDRLLRPYFDSL